MGEKGNNTRNTFVSEFKEDFERRVNWLRFDNNTLMNLSRKGDIDREKSLNKYFS